MFDSCTWWWSGGDEKEAVAAFRRMELSRFLTALGHVRTLAEFSFVVIVRWVLLPSPSH